LKAATEKRIRAGREHAQQVIEREKEMRVSYPNCLIPFGLRHSASPHVNFAIKQNS